MKKIMVIGTICLVLTGFLNASETTGEKINPEQALSRLKEGHARYLSGAMIHPHAGQDRRAELAGGQHPFVTILGCSDSRVPPEVLFDLGLGDIFTIRVAGNVADTDEIATVEYGTAHLGTSLVVVLGHSFCGAVTAVVSGGEAEGNLPGLLDNVGAPAERARAALGAGAPQANLVERAVLENTRQSMADLLTRSAVVSELVEAGKIRVIGAVYHLETGTVDWLEEHPQQEKLLELGLSAEEFHGFNGGTLIWIFVFPLAGAAALLWAVFKLFVSRERVFSGLKIRGRLAASFLGVGGVLTLVQIYLSLLPAEATGGIPGSAGLWPVALLTIPFALWYSSVHERLIKEFIADLRRRWSEGL